MNIVFVCTGNTCRSPLAEGILKKIVGDTDDIKVLSRGLAATEFSKASDNSIRAAMQFGVDISNHRSHILTQDDVYSADLVLTMTSSQAQAIRNALPGESSKVYSIDEYTGCGDIDDPYGGDYDVYLKCASQLMDAAKEIYQKIQEKS